MNAAAQFTAALAACALVAILRGRMGGDHQGMSCVKSFW